MSTQMIDFEFEHHGFVCLFLNLFFDTQIHVLSITARLNFQSPQAFQNNIIVRSFICIFFNCHVECPGFDCHAECKNAAFISSS